MKQELLTIQEPLGSPQVLGGVYVATIEEPLGSTQGLGGVYVATIEEPLGSPQGLGEVYVATIEEPQGLGGVYVVYLFTFLCCAFFVFCLSSFCVLHSMLPLSGLSNLYAFQFSLGFIY